MTTQERIDQARAIIVQVAALSEQAYELLEAFDDNGESMQEAREAMRLVWLETAETASFAADDWRNNEMGASE